MARTGKANLWMHKLVELVVVTYANMTGRITSEFE
jgi:hypothetical protein